MSTINLCSDFFKVLRSKITGCRPQGDHYFNLAATVILIFGLISNALLLATLTRKKLIKNPNNVFLVAIAICGFIACAIVYTTVLLDSYTDNYTYQWTYIWATVLPICYLVCAIHTWSLVCLAGWRVMTLDFPLQNSVRMTRKRIVVNIVVITAVVIAFHLPHYVSTFIAKEACLSTDPLLDRGDHGMIPLPSGTTGADNDTISRTDHAVATKYNVYYISSRNKNLETIGFYVHSIAMQVIPNIFLLIFTIILLKKLSDAKKRKQQLLMARNGVHQESVEPCISGRHTTVNQTKSDAVECRETRVVIETSHALALIFVVSLACDLPISIKILVDLIRNPNMDKVLFSNIKYICNIFKLLNCSLVLILCSITSSLFRTEFILVVRSITSAVTFGQWYGMTMAKDEQQSSARHEMSQTRSTSVKE